VFSILLLPPPVIQRIYECSITEIAFFNCLSHSQCNVVLCNYSIKKDPEFSHSRRVFDAKMKSLKAMGKGNKPNAAEPLNSEELSILREKRIIGSREYHMHYSNFTIVSTLLFLKTILQWITNTKCIKSKSHPFNHVNILVIPTSAFC